MNAATLVFLATALSGLNEESFEQLHRELQPPENEIWRSIPWQVSLLDAQALAAGLWLKRHQYEDALT